jgi:hypothetical protein
LAVGRVFLSEQLRPWYDAGIRHLFTSTQVLCDELQDVSRETPEASVSQREQEHRLGVVPRTESSANVTESAIEPVATMHASETMDAHDILWQEHYSKFSGPAFSIWTYTELGQDMFASPDTNRRDFLKQLLPSAGMPKGSIRFWPFALADGTVSSRELQWFWKGVATCQARLVLVFGESGILQLSGNASMAMKNRLAPDAVMAVLPSLEQLAAMPAAAFLRHFLQLREYLCSCLT